MSDDIHEDGNPNFGELMADLRLLWKRWGGEEADDRLTGSHSRASTRRMCMEDVERLIEKYGGSIE